MIGRDKEITPLVRGCFLPEPGEVWLKPDVSQAEFRLIVHYASVLKLPRAQEAVAMYRDNPDTDFHNLVVDWTALPRDDAKGVNFAKAYRAGKDKFATMIRRDLEEASDIYAKYDAELPFVSALGERCQHLAERRGYLKLLDGARLHFDRWEPARRDGNPGYALSEQAAKEKWPRQRLRRAFCYMAMNGLIQAGAARQTKKWMKACWDEGIVPLLQLHDELDTSVSSEATGIKMAELMRDCLKLQVPVRVGLAYGVSWGDAKHAWKDVGKQEKVK
jgi:DNA polymerase I-like protein with 3'-5' exonuclease and polymerase domains